MLILTALVSVALAHPQLFTTEMFPGEYIAPSLTDKRGPCPGFNTMANHGYLPRDGRNVDDASIIGAFVKHYDLTESLAKDLLDGAFNAGIGDSQNRTLSLDQLSQHGLY